MHVTAVQVDDQGLVNTDPRNVAVPNTWVNLIPTDVRGLTFSRTPQMVSLFLWTTRVFTPLTAVHACRPVLAWGLYESAGLAESVASLTQ